MKIFANNFCVVLRLAEEQGHFGFVRSSLAEVEDSLGSPLPYPGVSWYVDAGAEAGLLDRVLALQRSEAVAGQDAVLNLVFGEAGALGAFADALRGRYHAVLAAGGLVIGPGPSLLMMVRDGKVDLPKGKVEKGEAVAEAAWREVAEETGLQGHVLGAPAAETWHVYQRRGRWDFKTTHWYWMRSGEAEALTPQGAEGITAVRWVPLAELSVEIPRTYPQIMDLSRLALSELK